MTKETPVRVVIVEDDDDIREGLALLLGGDEDFECVATYRDGESALAGIEEVEADVILMDIQLPGISGIEAVERVREKRAGLDVIMLTIHKDDELVFQSLAAGASGYLLKDSPPERIMDAIREVRGGGAPMSSNIARRIVESFRKAAASPLTQRETEVLGLLCQGSSYHSIARKLFVSEPTVHFHIKNIYRKLQVHSKSAAVAKAIRERLV